MICTICAQDKPLSEFPLNRRRCKACRRQVEKARSAAKRLQDRLNPIVSEPPPNSTRHDEACAKAGIWFGAESMRPGCLRPGWLARHTTTQHATTQHSTGI